MKYFVRWVVAWFLCAACMAVGAKTVLIDVRTETEYVQEHIDGAIHMDHRAISRLIDTEKIAKNDTVILYCRSGRRSALAQETLKAMGFSHVENYGGMEEARRRLGKP